MDRIQVEQTFQKFTVIVELLGLEKKLFLAENKFFSIVQSQLSGLRQQYTPVQQYLVQKANAPVLAQVASLPVLDVDEQLWKERHNLFDNHLQNVFCKFFEHFFLGKICGIPKSFWGDRLPSFGWAGWEPQKGLESHHNQSLGFGCGLFCISE